MYADDSFISWWSVCTHLYFYINKDLQCLTECLEDNNFVLNVSKTKCLIFTSQRHTVRDSDLSLNLPYLAKLISDT